MKTFLTALGIAFLMTMLASGLGIVTGATAVITYLVLIALGSLGIVLLADSMAVPAGKTAE